LGQTSYKGSGLGCLRGYTEDPSSFSLPPALPLHSSIEAGMALCTMWGAVICDDPQGTTNCESREACMRSLIMSLSMRIEKDQIPL